MERRLNTALVFALGLILTTLWALSTATSPRAQAVDSTTVALEGRTGERNAVRSAHVITVCLAADGPCDYDNIQSAVDAAADGDLIKVASGVYTGVSARPRRDITTAGVVTQVVYVSNRREHDCRQCCPARCRALPGPTPRPASGGLRPTRSNEIETVIRRAELVVDALIGYSLHGVPRGRGAELIVLCNTYASRVLALDVPSGLDATTGEMPGVVVQAERTLTLALSKTGLRSIAGEIFVADIGIPPEVYQRLGLSFEPFFANRYWARLHR